MVQVDDSLINLRAFWRSATEDAKMQTDIKCSGFHNQGPGCPRWSMKTFI